VLSEWTKLRSLPSSGYALGAAALLMAAIGPLAAAVIAGNWPTMSAVEQASFSPLATGLRGFWVAQLAVAVFGVLSISGEYATGMVRTTFVAVPRRLPVLWAKTGVVGVAVAVVALPAALIAFFGSQSLLASQHISIAFSHPGVPRAVIGAGLYLSLVALLGFGLGAIIRNAAGAIAALVGILILLPVLVSTLGSSLSNSVLSYLPSEAGQAIMSLHAGPHSLAPWAGLGLLAGYVAGTIAIAALLVRRRDV
jgi:hypothetical protein